MKNNIDVDAACVISVTPDSTTWKSVDGHIYRNSRRALKPRDARIAVANSVNCNSCVERDTCLRETSFM